uniref:Uncharacterized protein n=1 Tax=Glossina brevipalpis TaxID=37001 RepID=A0A1A9WPC3_9MUSC
MSFPYDNERKNYNFDILRDKYMQLLIFQVLFAVKGYLTVMQKLVHQNLSFLCISLVTICVNFNLKTTERSFKKSIAKVSQTQYHGNKAAKQVIISTLPTSQNEVQI